MSLCTTVHVLIPSSMQQDQAAAGFNLMMSFCAIRCALPHYTESGGARTLLHSAHPFSSVHRPSVHEECWSVSSYKAPSPAWVDTAQRGAHLRSIRGQFASNFGPSVAHVVAESVLTHEPTDRRSCSRPNSPAGLLAVLRERLVNVWTGIDWDWSKSASFGGLWRARLRFYLRQSTESWLLNHRDNNDDVVDDVTKECAEAKREAQET